VSDYFAVLGLPRHLALDSAALSQRYRERSWATHPDRRTRAEQGEAMAESALLNEAYRTLRDPYRRAQHLLSLEGIALSTTPPQDLLMEVFEVQELLEDPDTPAQVLKEQQKHWQGRVKDLDQALSEASSAWDRGDQGALPQLQKVLLQRQYFLQILEKLMAIG